MEKNQNHSNLSSTEVQSKRFFSNGTFEWTKNKSVVWSELDQFIEQHPARKKKVDLRVVQWTVAAVFLLLVGSTAFMRFYTQTLNTPVGKHLVYTLPDGSTVQLNALSTLKYNPLWWRFERKMAFEGEGFFEVTKGRPFTVNSSLGTTRVLGTSFNIYSRDEVYRVTCITGKVKVTSKSNDEVILSPNSKAIVNKVGTISLDKDIKPLPEISWKNNIFLFTAIPVREVFKEIERQYGVTINVQIPGNTLYTGNFSKNQHVEEILGYICPALGYKFLQKSTTEYYIIPDQE